ncbi:MAG: hypothetical protein APR63_14200 [Desulfuromonas sp. SDB]|nr:MAG: hypothetical protein APR63_14200 [Desulfuromonas sp. SDB]
MKKFLVVAFMILATASMSAMVWNYHAPSNPVFAPDSGTPDVYGYVYVMSGDPGGPTYDWIDITTIGTQVTGLADDNVVGPFPIGFTFPYYWYSVNQVYIGSNGYCSFTHNNNLAHPFHNIPYPVLPNDLLAIYTGDLTFDAGNGECYYYTSPTNDTFIVSFIDVLEWDMPGTYHTFQVILTAADSTITYQFGAQNGTYNHSGEADMSGIENITGTIGLQFFRDGVAGAGAARPDSGMAVAYIPPESTTYEVHDAGVVWVDNELSGGIFSDKNITYTPSALIKNFGNQDEGSFDVICNILYATGNTVVYADTQTIASLNAGDIDTLTFADLVLPDEDTIWRMQVRTYLTGDMTAANDSITLRVATITPPEWLHYRNAEITITGSSWNGDSSGYGNQFVPPTYPFTLDSVALFVPTFTVAGGLQFVVMDDDGSEGGPGTILFDQTMTVTDTGWKKMAVTPPIEITEGSFYVGGITLTTSTFTTGTNAVPPGAISRRAYEFTGSWAMSRESESQDVWVTCHGTWNPIAVEEDPVITTTTSSFYVPSLIMGGSVFSLSLSENSQVSVDLFDLTGRHVANLANGEFSAGQHAINFNGEDLSTGVYFISTNVNGETGSFKFNLLK